MKVQTEPVVVCPVCDSAERQLLLSVPDHESQTGIYGIDECTFCGAAFTNPRPLESELPKLYEERTTTDFPRTGGFVTRLRDAVVDRYLQDQLGTVPGNSTVDFRVLDYGCGDGALTRGLLRLGASRNCAINVTSVDFHHTAPIALASIEGSYVYESNEHWSKNQGQYDAIFIRHVLEHHPDPRRLLRELAQCLRPQGRLFIEVPNRRSLWSAIFRSNYSGYYVPRHLLHFDASSLRIVLETSDMQIGRISLAHTPLVGRSLGYLLGRNIGNTGLVGLACYPVQVVVDMLLGRSTTLRASALRRA